MATTAGTVTIHPGATLSRRARKALSHRRLASTWLPGEVVLGACGVVIERGGIARMMRTHQSQRPALSVELGRTLVVTDRRVLVFFQSMFSPMVALAGPVERAKVLTASTAPAKVALVNILLLDVTFTDGGHWKLEVANLERKRALAFVAALGLSTAGAGAPLQAAQPCPGSWHPDPVGRFELRWWDGSVWTSSVADAGRVGSDPVPVG